MIAAIRKESKVYSDQNYTKCAPVTGKKLFSSWFTLYQKQRTLFIYKLCIINWQLVNYFRIDISDTADKLQYQTQNISKHLQISNHPCTANPGQFWLHKHTLSCAHLLTVWITSSLHRTWQSTHQCARTHTHTSEDGPWAQMHISQLWVPLVSSCAFTLHGF